MPRPSHIRRHSKRHNSRQADQGALTESPRPKGRPLKQKIAVRLMKNTFTKERVLGLLRHALTFGGGFLVAEGKLDQAGLMEGVAAVLTLVGLVWSALAPEKKPQA